MKKRDKRKQRERKLERAKIRTAEATADLKRKDDPVTVKVIKDSRGRQYIKAPDGSLRRGDKVNPDKIDWLAEA